MSYNAPPQICNTCHGTGFIRPRHRFSPWHRTMFIAQECPDCEGSGDTSPQRARFLKIVERAVAATELYMLDEDELD